MGTRFHWVWRVILVSLNMMGSWEPCNCSQLIRSEGSIEVPKLETVSKNLGWHLMISEFMTFELMTSKFMTL